MKIKSYIILAELVLFGFILGTIFESIVFFEPEIYSESVENGSSGQQKEILAADNDYFLPLEIVAAPGEKEGKKEIEISAKAALVIDDASGKILFDKNADVKTPVASLTKLATAVAILELSGEKSYISGTIGKKYDLDKIVEVTQSAIDAEGDSAFLKKGEKIKVRDLLAMMLVASSNDAATLLAEDASADLGYKNGMDDFAKLMNDIVLHEGLNNTNFVNSTGIDAKGGYSNAQDVIKITRKFLRDYPDIFQTTKTSELNIRSADGKADHLIKNTNKLINDLPGIIGGKTGYTDEAGESLMIVVEDRPGGNKIIAVVIGANDRFKEMKKLVNWVWESYEWK